MLEISDITGKPKSINEAITDIRCNSITQNETAMHKRLAEVTNRFKEQMQSILTRKQKRGGNFAVAEVDVDGFTGTVKSVRKFSNLAEIGMGGKLSPENIRKLVNSENIALLKPDNIRVFKTIEYLGIPRQLDTEAKILEEIASKLGTKFDATGTINLYTKLPPCPSCKSVISQFMDRYPNIKINLCYN